MGLFDLGAGERPRGKDRDNESEEKLALTTRTFASASSAPKRRRRRYDNDAERSDDEKRHRHSHRRRERSERHRERSDRHEKSRRRREKEDRRREKKERKRRHMDEHEEVDEVAEVLANSEPLVTDLFAVDVNRNMDNLLDIDISDRSWRRKQLRQEERERVRKKRARDERYFSRKVAKLMKRGSAELVFSELRFSDVADFSGDFVPLAGSVLDEFSDFVESSSDSDSDGSDEETERQKQERIFRRRERRFLETRNLDESCCEIKVLCWETGFARYVCVCVCVYVCV
ncbi:MAG: hypothetical protein MHM6MM_008401 [Cercozoa sp. M6MM]